METTETQELQGIPARVVFGFPDVSPDTDVSPQRTGEASESSAPSIATRVTEGSRGVPARKVLTLFSVFIFYAMTGVVTAKMVVWVFGGSGSAANALTMENPLSTEDGNADSVSGETRRESVQFENRLFAGENYQDPAVSEQLRHLLQRKSNTRNNSEQEEDSRWNRERLRRTTALSSDGLSR